MAFTSPACQRVTEQKVVPCHIAAILKQADAPKIYVLLSFHESANDL